MISPLCLLCLAAMQPLISTEKVELEFAGYGGTRLSGELIRPKVPGKGVAVLLLPGSGPTDRNGNQAGFKTDLLSSLAQSMSEAGIVTFRFDKRAAHTTLNKEQWPSDRVALNNYFTWESMTGDAAAAFRLLKYRPEVDPQRVVILGHSEGGVFAIELSQRVAPAGLALLGTPGRSFGDLMIEQIDAAMVRQRVPEAIANTIMEQNRDVIATYRRGEPYEKQLHPGLAPLYNEINQKYLMKAVSFEPSQVLEKFKGPVFIGQGERDIQVIATKDFMKLQGAIKPSQRSTYLSPGTSHNFKAVNDPNKETGFTGPVDPGLLKALQNWLRVTFKPKVSR